MSLEMIYAQKGVAALIAGKLQASKGVPYAITQVATGFKVEPAAASKKPKAHPVLVLNPENHEVSPEVMAAITGKKKPAPQAAKPGTATGDDALAGPIVEEVAADQTVILILPFRGESPAYIDAFWSGKPISLGRKQVISYGVKGVFVELTVSRKYAKSKGFVS